MLSLMAYIVSHHLKILNDLSTYSSSSNIKTIKYVKFNVNLEMTISISSKMKRSRRVEKMPCLDLFTTSIIRTWSISFSFHVQSTQTCLKNSFFAGGDSLQFIAQKVEDRRNCSPYERELPAWAEGSLTGTPYLITEGRGNCPRSLKIGDFGSSFSPHICTMLQVA